jgi:hypothetical protein
MAKTYQKICLPLQGKCSVLKSRENLVNDFGWTAELNLLAVIKLHDYISGHKRNIINNYFEHDILNFG